MSTDDLVRHIRSQLPFDWVYRRHYPVVGPTGIPLSVYHTRGRGRNANTLYLHIVHNEPSPAHQIINVYTSKIEQVE